MATDALETNTDTTLDNLKTTAVAEAATALSPDQQEKRAEADALIRRYALLGTASGLIPVLGLDVAATTAIQTKMIKDLADVYEIDISDQILRTAISSGVTSLVTRILTEAASRLAGTLGPLKMLVNGATTAAVNGFMTLEVGNLYRERMEAGDNPADVSIMNIADHVITKIKAGEWDPSKHNLTSQLKALV